MTYDILAFDPSATTNAEFDAWWGAESAWGEDHEYEDPAVTTPALRAFYQELIQTFQPLNGPDAPDEEDIEANPELETLLTDYSIGSRLVYAAFSWSVAEAARALFANVARKPGVAVAFVSDGWGIIRPEEQ
jgi:hypothetical protein